MRAEPSQAARWMAQSSSSMWSRSGRQGSSVLSNTVGRFSPLGPLATFVFAKLVKAQMTIGPFRIAIQKLGNGIGHFLIWTGRNNAGLRRWHDLSNLPWTESAQLLNHVPVRQPRENPLYR